MNVFLSLSYLDPVNTSTDNATLVQCPIKIPLATWDSSSFNAVAKVSTLLAVTVNILTMPFTTFFNALIIFVVWKNPSLQVERVIVLAYLALTDFLVGLVCQPLYIVRGVLQLKTSDNNCDMDTAYVFSGLLFVTAAFHQLVLLTYERYVAVIHPYQYPKRITVKRLTYATIVLWALNTPVVISYFVLLAVGVPVRFINIAFVVTATTFTSVMIYWYVRIIAAIRRQNRQLSQEQHVNMNNLRTLQNHKAVITGGLLLGCFFVSILPLICTLVLRVLGFSLSGSVSLSLRRWVLTSIQLASFANPIIYGLRMRELREKCLRLLRFETRAA